ncbi:MAG: nucleoside hydrolase [Anaerolineales bacterium]|nr:nucleoside hydrolase [Anaerolineales bacterium]
MKRKIWIVVLSILGLIILIQLAGMLLARLGVPVYYIQSDGNGIQLVRSIPQTQSLPALQPNNAAPLMEDATPFIIDTDMAGDDWMAILYLLQRPDVNVVAITVTGTGEAHCAPGIRNALDLVMLAGRPKIPVTCGPESPLMGDHAFPTEWRDAVDNLFGLSLPRNPTQPSSDSAPDMIARLLRESDQNIHIVALGPLTNIAEAFDGNASLNNYLEMLTIMGGAVNTPGNVGPVLNIENQYAEWNFYADPYAAKVVFDTVSPITLVPLDATQYAPMTMDFYKQTKKDRTTPAAEFVYRILTQIEDRIRQGGYYFWDPLAAVIASDGSLANFQDLPLVVIAEAGPDSGRTLENKDGQLIRVAIWADASRFEELFLDTLNGRLP